MAIPDLTWNCSLSINHIIIKIRKKIQWEAGERWKNGEPLSCVLTRFSQLTLCSRASTESGLMPSALHRLVMVNLRVKGTRTGQAVLLDKNRRSTHYDRIGLHLNFCQVLLKNNSNSFPPKQVFGLWGFSSGHKGYTHFNVLWFVILAIIYTMFQDAEKIIKTTSATK